MTECDTAPQIHPSKHRYKQVSFRDKKNKIKYTLRLEVQATFQPYTGYAVGGAKTIRTALTGEKLPADLPMKLQAVLGTDDRICELQIINYTGLTSEVRPRTFFAICPIAR